MRACPNCAFVVEDANATRCPECKTFLPQLIRKAVEKRRTETARPQPRVAGSERRDTKTETDGPKPLMLFLSNGVYLGIINTILMFPPLGLLYLFTAPAAEFFILTRYWQSQAVGYKSMAVITFIGNAVFFVAMFLATALGLAALVLMKTPIDLITALIAAIAVIVVGALSFAYQMVIGAVFIYLKKREAEPEVE